MLNAFIYATSISNLLFVLLGFLSKNERRLHIYIGIAIFSCSLNAFAIGAITAGYVSMAAALRQFLAPAISARSDLVRFTASSLFASFVLITGRMTLNDTMGILLMIEGTVMAFAVFYCHGTLLRSLFLGSSLSWLLAGITYNQPTVVIGALIAVSSICFQFYKSHRDFRTHTSELSSSEGH